MVVVTVLIAAWWLVQAPAGLPLVERQGVGPVVIGKAAQEIYGQFPSDRRVLTDLGYEGMLSPALFLRLPGGTKRDGLVAELVPRGGELVVWRVEVRDPTYRTAKGVGVGSTVAELRAAYAVHSFVTGEGNFGFRVAELSATFLVDVKELERSRFRREDRGAAVPGTVRIRSILLTGAD